MPYRQTPLISNNVYHVFNRGVAKLPIFYSQEDYLRFIDTIVYYQVSGPKPKFSHRARFKSLKNPSTDKLVDILAYCLMPNHYHFVLKQLKEGGISEFMRKFIDSYTKFFNTKYDRVGPLLQGEFKAKQVETSEQLIYLSKYIHLNPAHANLVTDLTAYPWSSYLEYVSGYGKIATVEPILSLFNPTNTYKEFIHT